MDYSNLPYFGWGMTCAALISFSFNGLVDRSPGRCRKPYTLNWVSF